MKDKRENETVSGNANSIYAAQAGEGPVNASEVSKHGERFEGQSVGRQDGGATIRSHPLSKTEGMLRSSVTNPSMTKL